MGTKAKIVFVVVVFGFTFFPSQLWGDERSPESKLESWIIDQDRSTGSYF